MQKTKKKIIIKGEKVHNVGYRLHLLEKAEELLIPNIGAWNIYEDGKEAVRVLVGGDEGKVKEFLNFLRESFPEEADVEGTPTVEDYEGDIPTIEAFSRSFSTAQLTKIAKVGVGMLKKQDQMLEKQDETIKVLGEKIDKVGDKIDNGFAKTDQNFTTLREDYGRISKDIALAVQGIEKVSNNIEKLIEKSDRDREKFENAILKLAEKR